MKHSISALFLAPLLNFRQGAPRDPYALDYYEQTYTGDIHMDQYKDWKSGKYILLEYKDTLPEDLAEHLQKRPDFVETYEPRKGYRMFVFTLPEEVKETYTDHVLAGKYSQADKAVVDKYFPDVPSHVHYGNRLVFYKSPLWAEQWESKIGQPLPEGAEVFTRPTASTELYGHVEDNATIPGPATPHRKQKGVTASAK